MVQWLQVSSAKHINPSAENETQSAAACPGGTISAALCLSPTPTALTWSYFATSSAVSSTVFGLAILVTHTHAHTLKLEIQCKQG